MKSLKAAEVNSCRDSDARRETDEIVNEFLSESRELLGQIDHDLTEFLKGTSGNELPSSIFRNLHSIKGASGFLRFARIERITHAGESVLCGVRKRTLPLSPEVSISLHEIVDSLHGILDSIETTGREGSGDDVELLNELRRLESPHQPCAVQSSPSCETLLATSEADRGSPVEDYAKPIGQLLIERAGVSAAAVQAARDLQRRGDVRTMGEILVSQGAVTSVAAREIAEYQQEARAASVGDTSVRVEVMLLDKIVSLAEDVVLSAGRLTRSASVGHDPAASRVTQQLLRVATRLHREAVNTRVQPLAAVEAPLVRLVKDLSNLSGKHVRLESKGTNIRVDRVVLAAIKDPLLHLVRNAIDHGIESPQEHVTSGKLVEGRITIHATCIDGQVVVSVSDDGAGIDLERVRQRAVEQGVVAPDRISSMSDTEIVDLVFLPGFTTARSVSYISGRGVGMDIVRAKTGEEHFIALRPA